jgi:NAD+ kinase
MRNLGLVVHPTRHLDEVLATVTDWAAERDVEVGQVRVEGQTREVAEPVDPADCEILVAVGGDGTTLAALHEAAPASRPVLGLACGSIGVLTSTAADHAREALDRIEAGDWTPAPVPALAISFDRHEPEMAINDLAVLRDGPGQALVSVTVDEVLYARIAGDGVVVATALGSSAYTMAAGGPILAPGADCMVITPLAAHGGSSPPLVTSAASRITLGVEAGHAGVRSDIDGRRTPMMGGQLEIGLRAEYSTLVRLADEEPRLTGLRRRGLIQDSPRVLVREGRLGPHLPTQP